MAQEYDVKDPRYWIELLFQKGALVVSEAFGVIFLLRASTSFPKFNLEAAVIGAILVLTGVVFEYLIWLKKLSFTEERLKTVEERLKKDIESAREIAQAALNAAPRTSGGRNA